MRYELIEYIWSSDRNGYREYDICYKSGRYRSGLTQCQLPQTAIDFILTALIKSEKYDGFYGNTIVYTNR